MTGKSLRFEGIPFPSLDYSPEHLREVQESFLVKDEDVLLLTFPKSGTNWLIETVCLIYSKGDPKWIQSEPIWDRSPWVETKVGYELLKEKEGPRLISSHLPIQLFPTSFFKSKAKMIYLIRNPRDVFVSGYFFWKNAKFVKRPQSLEQYFEWFVEGNARDTLVTETVDGAAVDMGESSDVLVYGSNATDSLLASSARSSALPGYDAIITSIVNSSVVFGSWFDHIRGWMSMRDKENCLILSYEEMKWDTRSTVEKICQFLGRKLEPDELNSVLKNSSFQAMKENNMSNYSLLKGQYFEENGQLLRKGVTGDWKNYFTVAQAETFDKLFQEKMADLPQDLFLWK